MNETEHTTAAKECEDFLFPARSFSPRERALYYHLLRHTHLEGRPSALFALLPLANAIGVAESSVREDIRALHDRGCIRIEDKSRNGHLVRVLLPSEIPGVVPETVSPEEVDLESIDFFENRRYVAELLAREDGRCFYCMKGIRAESCELDHVVSQAISRNNSYRNIACSCHECNTTKQAQAPADFVRGLYRRGVLSQAELENRLAALDLLQSGKLKPDLALLRNAA
jgi:5-methylcytosine-specific restriction endonuclease McrA